MSCIIKPNHIALSGASDIKQICQSLFDKTGISHFTFARQYSDGSRFSLSTDAEWTKHFFKHVQMRDLLGVDFISKNISPYWLWAGLPMTSLRLDAVHFDIANGITISNKDDEKYTEYYYFGAKRRAIHMNNFFIINLDLLQKFILFFNEKAKKLIDLSRKKHNRITVPSNCRQEVISLEEVVLQKIDSSFLKPNKIAVNNHGAYLTKKEIELSMLLLAGNSAAEIGELLNISKRTADAHIENIKSKLDCRKKSALFKKLYNLNINSLIKIGG